LTLVREQLALAVEYNTNGQAELRDAAAAQNKSLPVHRWVPWIAGFSAQFVEDAIEGYLPKSNRSRQLVLDPFAGVGTTMVEALKAGCNTIGYEINPFAALAARAKMESIDLSVQRLSSQLDEFRLALEVFEAEVDGRWAQGGEEAVAEVLAALSTARPSGFRSRIRFFSPPIEAKFLYALGHVASLPEMEQTLFRVALGATMISYSNYTYEPSLSSRPGAGKPLIENASVALPVCRKLGEMVDDIRWAQEKFGEAWRRRQRNVISASYFNATVPSGSVSLLVTSPPYMNNYHYVRNTRPQLHWLGLINGSDGLRDCEQESFGKFWQTVRQAPPIDVEFSFPELAEKIRYLRGLSIDRGAYGGPGWANYVTTYFNDSSRFLRLVRRQLKPGARAIIVVGNSIIQGVEFQVDHLLAQMAEQSGLAVEDIRIVRTKRVGNSIIDSSVRNGHNHHEKRKTQLYDAAVILRA
jgi:DNA modification methylase